MMLAKYILRLAAKILTVILYLVTILAAYGGVVDPSLWALPSVFALGFLWLSILTVMAGLAWLLARRYLMAVGAALTLICCWGTFTEVFPLSTSKEAEPGDPTFTLLTYNILHGEDYRDKDYPGNRSLEFVLAANADIVCLQEMQFFNSQEIPHFSNALRDSLARRYPYRLIDSHNDLTLLSKYPAKTLSWQLPDGQPGNRSAYDIYQVDVKGRKLQIINVHLASYSLTEEERDIVTDIHGIRSAKSSLSEFKGPVLGKLKASFRVRSEAAEELAQIINQSAGPLIVCGDFNDVVNSWAYRQIRGDSMEDAYNQTNFGPAPTYNAHLFLFQIDHILYKGALEPLDVTVEKIKSSDHYPLLASFRFLTPNPKK